MVTLSIRIPDDLLREVDSFAELVQIPRAAYVRKALEQMNAAVSAQHRRARLMAASLKVRAESLRVNAEFDEIEDAPHERGKGSRGKGSKRQRVKEAKGQALQLAIWD